MMGEEKRKYKRKSADPVLESNIKIENDANVLNISEEGLLLDSPVDLEMNHELKVDFKIIIDGKDYHINCNSLVRWHQKVEAKYRIGVAFLDMQESDRALIRDYVASSEAGEGM